MDPPLSPPCVQYIDPESLLSHLCISTFKLCLTFISLSHLCTASAIIVLLYATSPKDAPFHPTSLYVTQCCPKLPYIVSSQIHLGILHIHYISYVSSFLIGCWRKGWPVLTLIIHFSGSSHCKCINTFWRSKFWLSYCENFYCIHSL